MVGIQDHPILLDELFSRIRSDADGAVVLFAGTVRDHNRGRRVQYLEYEAFGEMAESEMAAIDALARERFAVSDLAIVHRTGRLEIGEISVAVVVAAPHRGAALDAGRFVIDTLKRTVPIWKKEVFEGGEAWIEGPGETPTGEAR